MVAWLEVGLLVALPLVGFFVARLQGLLAGVLIAGVLAFALRALAKP